jgi:hypothetical protein
MKFFVHVTVVRVEIREVEAKNADEAADRARVAADVVHVLGVTAAAQKPNEPTRQ